jgi:beta-aspartyl-peptidase (threonine type)
MMQPVIVVHGGAWHIPDEVWEAHQAGCQVAARAGWEVLARGGSALDAVETAIRLMEDDPTFDAGVGSVLNADGLVELDAGMMDGRTFNLGAVAAVPNIRHPITLARRVLESPHTLLVCDGALRFAREVGITECRPEELIVQRERAAWERYRANPALLETEFGPHRGTVGAVALDQDGNIVAGISTGGRAYKRPGRVGDSPLVGCGFYADNLLGGASSTGDGEAISRIMMARRAVDGLTGDRHPQVAANEAIEYLGRRVAGRGGLILLDRHGRVGVAFNTPRMAWAGEGMENEREMR